MAYTVLPSWNGGLHELDNCPDMSGTRVQNWTDNTPLYGGVQSKGRHRLLIGKSEVAL